MGGDYGILGNNDGARAPIDGTNEPYPDYFALQLASKIMQNGGTVVSATEDNETNVDTYAVLEANGDLELLVVNKTSPGTCRRVIFPIRRLRSSLTLMASTRTATDHLAVRRQPS